MKVLLDENLPQDLRHSLLPHDVSTVQFAGWKGLKNGRLLAAAGIAGFDVMVTLDGGLPHEQNAKSLPLSLVLLSAPSSDISDLLPLVPALLATLQHLPARSIARVP